MTSITEALAKELAPALIDEVVQSTEMTNRILDLIEGAMEEPQGILLKALEKYLREHPQSTVNPRPDSMEFGVASERVKIYFNAMDTQEALLIEQNAIKVREDTLKDSAYAIDKRRDELKPKGWGKTGGD